ncbi:hypothetical protein GL2_41780 [Microbulbifer sp. GL-2]|nr:hypothetical protein GL2_41780 [Microbulbifer sp. GL-2]
MEVVLGQVGELAELIDIQLRVEIDFDICQYLYKSLPVTTHVRLFPFAEDILYRLEWQDLIKIAELGLEDHSYLSALDRVGGSYG